MSKEIILQKLLGILKEKLSVSKEINENTALPAEDVLDSMEFLKYLTLVEEEFGISISDEDLGNYKLGNIKNMTEYISKV